MISVAVRHALGDFTLDVAFETGARVVALFGPSGSGKTTLLNIIAGLIEPQAGSVRIGDQVLTDTASNLLVPPHRRRMGYVFQDGRLFPHLTVRQNLLYGRWFAPAAQRFGSLDEVVTLLGLGSLMARKPGTLSGGEKQRVAIGRALLAGPRLLLMDEPLASLDAARKAETLPYIERLRDELNIPIVYVSHSADEVERLAAEVIRLEAGRRIEVGPGSSASAHPSLSRTRKPLT
jgi:molybdate transport system ATP-binding protein